MKKYDSNTISKVLKTYDTLTSYKDMANRSYSLTAIKNGLSKQYDLKTSDVDKILYGERLKTDKRLSEGQKEQIVAMYNHKDISVSDIAKSFSSKSSGKKISTDYIYKILHEKENSGYEIKWRGSPDALKKNKGIEAVVENPIAKPVKKTNRHEKKDWSLSFFNKVATGAIAAGLAVGTVLGFGITSRLNNYIENHKPVEIVQSQLAVANNNFYSNQLSPRIGYANLEDNLDNFDNINNKGIGLTDAEWVPKAGEGEVMLVRGKEFFPVKNKIDKEGFITLIKGQDVEYWEIPEAFR